MTDFCSLHNHTTYSIMDSLIKPTELFKKIKELGQTTVAVTDHGTLAGAWDCLKYSKEAGVKLIMGCEFYFVDDVTKAEQERLRHVILIAKNHIGYKNLLRLSKLANDNHIVAFKKVYPRIDWKMMTDHSEGLICTTACSGGILGQLICTRRIEAAREQAKKLKEIFGENLALEIQPHAMTRQANSYNDYVDQRLVNNQLIRFGKELDIKIVPTTNAHYLTKDQWEAHDVMLAIGAGQPIRSGARLKYTNDFYLKTREEVREFFARLYPAQIDEWLDNTLFFANMCETPDWIDPKFSNPTGKELPEFPVKDQRDYISFLAWRENPDLSPEETKYVQECADDIAYLRYWCYKNFNEKVPADKHEEYNKRLHEEFEVIEYHGFSSYMLIVADYINFARSNGIRVGPGRGSVSGCLVAYFLGIHQVDSIKYNLIFARFHNKLKTSYPDIDSDFEPVGRELVQKYIRDKYGEDKVAHVSNINTMTPKVFARDIARAFQYGGDSKSAVAIGTQLADSIPPDVKSMDGLFEKAPLFAEIADKKYPELKKYSKDLSSKAKAWSTHAAGLVIGKRSLEEIVPVRKDKDGKFALEYEKERAEANGLVKMDTLGLETLAIIDETNKLIAMNGKKIPEPFAYDQYDQKTYDLISRGDTLCVFQLGGSAGTAALCKSMQPKSIEDISLINALARPSAKDIREEFFKVKNGDKQINLIDEILKRSFGETYGFGVYEECLMFLAQDVAGWDLHKADDLRKMTKDKGKNPEKTKKLKEDFIESAVKNNVNHNIAKKIWQEIIENFGGYGFNHSLSVFEMIDIYSLEGKFIKSIPIGDLQPGCYIKSRDEKTQKDIFVEITNKYDHGILPLVEIELDTGEKVKCTISHKFRVKETGQMMPLWYIIKNKLSIVVNKNE